MIMLVTTLAMPKILMVNAQLARLHAGNAWRNQRSGSRQLDQHVKDMETKTIALLTGMGLGGDGVSGLLRDMQ